MTSTIEAGKRPAKKMNKKERAHYAIYRWLSKAGVPAPYQSATDIVYELSNLKLL
jgi:hypothetical protein